MKILFVLRHAKSSRDDPALCDFDRPLNARGRDAAKAIGRAMRERGIRPAAVLASPARRVVETLAGVIKGYDAPLETEWEARIYEASAPSLLDVIRAADSAVQRLLLVGHNPGLQELILQLSGPDDRGLYDEVASKFPTGALAELHLPIERWRDIEAGRAEIVSLLLPRDFEGAGA
jgi:phosphohistidine phosphatase